MKWMRKRGFKGHTTRMKLELGRKLDWSEDLSEGEKIGLRERFLSREMREKWNLNRASTIYRKCISMDRGFYQGSIKH